MPTRTGGTDAKKKERYYTPTEVEQHQTSDDCWVSLLGKVFDLTKLIADNRQDPLIDPIVEAAGKDISHWFEDVSGKLRTHVDPLTGCVAPYVPQGRFLHVPPNMPRSDWCTDLRKPWWLDDEAYCVGKLSQKTRKIRILNTLTKDEHVVEVCSEESLSQIQDRYVKLFNAHAKGYMWKRLGTLLDMSATLEENGVPDESSKFEWLGVSEDEWYPVIHLYFSDDLTVA